jgi:hypothetical protein
MKIDEILEMWKDECELDITHLDRSQAEAPKLHHKYTRLLINESLRFKKLEAQYKYIREERYYFLTCGTDHQYKAREWKLPARGNILKEDIKRYIESDEMVLEYQLKMAAQQEKLKLLESIIQQLNNRSFQIKNILEWKRLTEGAAG